MGTLARAANGSKSSPAPAWMRLVEDLLRSYFRESLSVREIATRVDVHRVHLARTFRSRHGCSVLSGRLRRAFGLGCNVLGRCRRSPTGAHRDCGHGERPSVTALEARQPAPDAAILPGRDLQIRE